MPTVDVLDIHKRKVGSVELHDGVFGVEADGPVVHTAVVMQQACARQGTASTLTRGEVSGSGRKPWKQKHTGRARAGSIRSPIWRHGGRVFGPRPRSYAYSLPKKKYRAALQSALSAKLAAGGIVVVSALTLEEPKTRRVGKGVGPNGMIGKTALHLRRGRTPPGSDRRELITRTH